ncbi:MAG: serine/threonine-protein kinase [Planctomycetota bacterium]
MSIAYQIGGYDVLHTLGKGAGSTLFEVCNDAGEKFCLKRVVKSGPSDQRFLDQAIHEHEIASSMDHPRLRRSFKLIRQRALIRTSEVLVLMELVDGKTLEAFQADDIEGFCTIMMQGAEALGAMHEAGYVHADIKPNNMMLDRDGGVKLIDFGQSCAIGTVKERIQGTPDYIAPEQVKRRAITPQTDVFNLGATMYWLLTGHYVPTMIPKNDSSVKVRASRPESPAPPIEHNAAVPPALSTLVMDCIAIDPADRPANMQHVIDRLEIARAQAARMEPVAPREAS